jgi:hypothetical protein
MAIAHGSRYSVTTNVALVPTTFQLDSATHLAWLQRGSRLFLLSNSLGLSTATCSPSGEVVETIPAQFKRRLAVKALKQPGPFDLEGHDTYSSPASSSMPADSRPSNRKLFVYPQGGVFVDR